MGKTLSPLPASVNHLARNNSPAVKGWPRRGRGSSALTAENQHQIPSFKFQVNPKSQYQNSKRTLNYPGAARHPFTEGELEALRPTSLTLPPVILSGVAQRRSRRTGVYNLSGPLTTNRMNHALPLLRLRAYVAPLRMTVPRKLRVDPISL
jgi:hypothetical protein